MAGTNGNGNGVSSAGTFWISAIQRVGLPTVALVVLWWQIVMPLKDGAIKQMDRQALETEKQTALIKTLADNYGILAQSEVRQVQLLDAINTSTRANGERLEEHQEVLVEIERAVSSP